VQHGEAPTRRVSVYVTPLARVILHTRAPPVAGVRVADARCAAFAVWWHSYVAVPPARRSRHAAFPLRADRLSPSSHSKACSDATQAHCSPGAHTAPTRRLRRSRPTPRRRSALFPRCARLGGRRWARSSDTASGAFAPAPGLLRPGGPLPPAPYAMAGFRSSTCRTRQRCIYKEAYKRGGCPLLLHPPCSVF
jgi:hypothetical protein